jgi:hypothetical protein
LYITMQRRINRQWRRKEFIMTNYHLTQAIVDKFTAMLEDEKQGVAEYAALLNDLKTNYPKLKQSRDVIANVLMQEQNHVRWLTYRVMFLNEQIKKERFDANG